MREYMFTAHTQKLPLPIPEKMTLSELVLISDEQARMRGPSIWARSTLQQAFGILYEGSVVNYPYYRVFKERTKNLGWSEAEHFIFTAHELYLIKTYKYGVFMACEIHSQGPLPNQNG